jgi:hexosaminidase
LINTKLKDNEYKLTVRGSEVAIFAKDSKGIFNGIQTLIQLLSSKSPIPNLEITDAPKFQWRGMHLDVSRHFFLKNSSKNT